MTRITIFCLQLCFLFLSACGTFSTTSSKNNYCPSWDIETWVKDKTTKQSIPIAYVLIEDIDTGYWQKEAVDKDGYALFQQWRGSFTKIRFTATAFDYADYYVSVDLQASPCTAHCGALLEFSLIPGIPKQERYIIEKQELVTLACTH